MIARSLVLTLAPPTSPSSLSYNSDSRCHSARPTNTSAPSTATSTSCSPLPSSQEARHFVGQEHTIPLSFLPSDTSTSSSCPSSPQASKKRLEGQPKRPAMPCHFFQKDTRPSLKELNPTLSAADTQDAPIVETQIAPRNSSHYAINKCREAKEDCYDSLSKEADNEMLKTHLAEHDALSDDWN